jgi:hypothetical protein
LWGNIVIREYDIQSGGVKVSLRGWLLDVLSSSRGKFSKIGEEPIRVRTALEMIPSSASMDILMEYIIAIAVIERQEKE